MTLFALSILAIMGAYALGFYDGMRSRPPEPLKGNYDSGEHEDRVEDYPEDWV